VAIAASATPTGSSQLGGDWSLEFTTGTIHAPLAFSATATAAYAHVLAEVALLTETFTNSDVLDKRWIFGVDDPTQGQRNPFLTARNTADAPEGGLPGNPSPGVNSYPPLDPDGSGTLRLTNVLNNQASYVLYDNPLPFNAGLIIEFDFFSYGGSGADGFSFFLADGSESNRPDRAGGFGGSLGYAPINAAFQGLGVRGGYIGIGYDEFGNYSNPNQSRVGGPGFTPNAIAIRGSEFNSYQYLAGNTVPFSLDNPGTGATRDGSLRRTRIEITPDGLVTVTVQADLNQDGVLDPNDPNEAPITVIDAYNILADSNNDGVPDNGIPPETLSFGFASGTGASTNVHEIRNLSIVQPTEPPDVADVTLNLPPGDAVNLPGLSATDPDGTIVSYIIETLPPADQGILYLGSPTGPAVTAGQVLTPDQITQLFFQPAAGFTQATFTYNARDNVGAQDETPGTVTLSVLTGQPPEADDLTASQLIADTANKLPELTATDPDGSIVSFTIVSLPSIADGILYLGDPNQGGRQLEAGETLTPDQVDQLFFQAEPDFDLDDTGSFTFYATDNDNNISNIATVTLTAGTVVQGCAPGIRRKGGGGNNNIKGTADADTLLGGAGNDTLRGSGCPDLLEGNQGNDRISGGNAGDVINGGLGRDRLNGDNGDDQIKGGRGNDTLEGGKGNDQLSGQLGNDQLNGQGGNDTLEGGKDNDTLKGGANQDVIQGRQNRDRIDGGGGNDLMYGNLAKDTITGGKGDDSIYGGKGNDGIKGNAGADFLTGQRSDDRLYGGSQADYVFGDVGNDTLIGGSGADTLNGSLGNDRFVFKNINHGGDLIEGFQLGDVFDFSVIFTKEGYTRTGTFAYIRQVQSGDDILIQIDSNGDRSGGFIDYLTVQGSTSPDLLGGGQITASNFIV
jgi:Ca2+-binding RTX toxin-like protein